MAFVHAGINESAGINWEIAITKEMFLEKFPLEKVDFYLDIIAGHISTTKASGNKNLHDIYYDGKSHFYIDGIDSYANNTWDDERVIPVLIYEETENSRTYFSLMEDSTLKIISEMEY